jgi:hypothetical protein
MAVQAGTAGTIVPESNPGVQIIMIDGLGKMTAAKWYMVESRCASRGFHQVAAGHFTDPDTYTVLAATESTIQLFSAEIEDGIVQLLPLCATQDFFHNAISALHCLQRTHLPGFHQVLTGPPPLPTPTTHASRMSRESR